MRQAAVAQWVRQGEDPCVASQNLIEFRNVATRPTDHNGFGLTPANADAEVSRLEAVFVLAPDTERVYPTWRRLVSIHAVSGVKVHDARLVAVMLVHRITHLLTLNPGDFTRYHEIATVQPQDVLAPP